MTVCPNHYQLQFVSVIEALQSCHVCRECAKMVCASASLDTGGRTVRSRQPVQASWIRLATAVRLEWCLRMAHAADR